MSEALKGNEAGVYARLIGKKIVKAESSLKSFVIEFEEQQGLAIDAMGSPDNGFIQVAIVDALSLPKLSEAVCSVDWSWIYGTTVESLTVGQELVKFKLNPAGPLSVALSFWQGSPFLSFHPFKSPVKQ